MRALPGFAKRLKLEYPDIGSASISILTQTLQSLLDAVGTAAQNADTTLIIFIEEVPYVPEDERAALILSLHSARSGADYPSCLWRGTNASSHAKHGLAWSSVWKLFRVSRGAAYRRHEDSHTQMLVSAG